MTDSNSDDIQRSDSIDHTDPDVLRYLYEDRKMSTVDIADISSVSQTQISRLLDQYGIETRDRIEASKMKVKTDHAKLKNQRGYQRWLVWNGDGDVGMMSVHRLLAIAEYGTDAVKDKVVHHKNGVKWDNRLDNLELMDAGEHSALHNSTD